MIITTSQPLWAEPQSLSTSPGYRYDLPCMVTCCWCPGSCHDFSSLDLSSEPLLLMPWPPTLSSAAAISDEAALLQSHGVNYSDLPSMLTDCWCPGSCHDFSSLDLSSESLLLMPWPPTLSSAAAISDEAALLQSHGANYSDFPCMVTSCGCPGACHDFSSLDFSSELLLLMPWPLLWLQQPRSQMKLRYFKAVV